MDKIFEQLKNLKMRKIMGYYDFFLKFKFIYLIKLIFKG